MNEPTSSNFQDPWTNLATAHSPVRVAFWWLTKRIGVEPPRFVYAFVVPARSIRRDEWGRRNVSEQGPWRLIRRTLDLPGAEAFRLMERLQEGKSLAVACSELDLPEPGVESDTLVVDDSWVRLPVIFLSSTPSQSFLSAGAQGRASFVSGVGSLCARVVPQDRLRFLDELENPDEVLHWMARELRAETGIAFGGGASDAFGSIEVFSFPALDLHERPRIETSFERSISGDGRLVHISVSGLDDSRVYAHVRAEQVKGICFDELLRLDSDGKGRVEIHANFDGLLVRVWKQGAQGRLELFDELEQHFIRQVHTRGHLLGLSGDVGASWLDKLPKRARSRAAAFTKITQVSQHVPIVVSDRSDWEKQLIATRAAVSRAIPPKSEARFFPAGWGETDESKLDFGIWLKEVLSRGDGKIVLTDPYFDLLGLDLICRASGAAREFVVLTSTILPSDDDKRTAQASRSDRLRRASEDLLTILRGLSLRILDLRSSGESNRQVFHDRYLLLFDGAWQIQEGFQLSTSLQSAATRSPILVTPIPSDVLDDVADYVTGLFNGSNAEIRFEILFPPAETRATRRHTGLSEQQGRDLMALMELIRGPIAWDSSEPLAKLRELGVYQEEKVVLSLQPEEISRIRAKLGSEDLVRAAPIWDGLSRVATRGWHSGIPNLLSEVFEPKEPDLGRFLRAYLVGHGKGVLRAEDASEHTRTTAHALKVPFVQAIGEASNFYDYHHRLPLGTSWPIHLATICLVQFFPCEVDEVVGDLENLAEEASNPSDSREVRKYDSQDRESATIQAQVPAVLSALVATFATFAQRHEGLVLPAEIVRSKIPLLRALFAISAWREARSDEPGWEVAWAEFLQVLAQYSVDERQEILAQAIYEVRIRANQNQPEWPVRRRVFEEFLQQLRPRVSIDKLVALIPFLSGPVLCNHATSIHNEILHPLVERGCLSDPEVFETWDRILQERMTDEYLGKHDTELVQVWGFAFWDATTEQRASSLKITFERVDKARWTLFEPFLYSRNYKRWASAQGVVLWGLFQLWSIRTQRSMAPGAERAGSEERAEVDLLFNSVRTFVEEERLVERAIGLFKNFGEHVLGQKSDR